MGFYCIKNEFFASARKRKRIFLEETFHIVVFSRSKGSNNAWFSVSFSHLIYPKLTLSHSLTHTSKHKYPHPSQTALTCTPLNDHAEHSSDFIHFRFYFIFVLCVYFYFLDKNCALFILLLLHETITWYYLALNPYLCGTFFGALLDFPRTKRRMQFGARKLATIHACTKRKNSKINETPISMLLLLLLLFDLLFHA